MASYSSPAQRAQQLTEDEIDNARDQKKPYNDAGHAVTGFAYPFDNPIFYIKFGNRAVESMIAEAKTQQFVFDALEKMPLESKRGIHIPQIFRILKTQQQRIYIIMAYVKGETLKQLCRNAEFKAVSRPYYDTIARGIKLLLSIPVPSNVEPGPYGGGIIQHPFFKDFEAPTRYNSVKELEEHINILATWFNKTAPKVTLEQELYLVYSDLYEGNFMFTETGELYIIDFEHASFLPLSFQDFALRSPSLMSWRVAGYIKDQFNLPQENLTVMETVSGLMNKSSWKLGLAQLHGSKPVNAHTFQLLQ